AIRLQTEYQAIDIISGFLRPMRSASQPDAVAPANRNQSVSVNTAVTAVSGTLNSRAIGSMISRKMVKSNESSVHPNQAATHACHWSRVGSFHHGIVTIAVAAMISSLVLRSIEPNITYTSLGRAISRTFDSVA